METLKFRCVIDGRMREVVFNVAKEGVSLKEVCAALKLMLSVQKKVLERVAGVVTDAMNLAAVQLWLASLEAPKTPRPDLTRHFQDHFVPWLSTASSAMRIEAAVKTVVQDTQPEIFVGHELEAVDHFRKDVSLGPNRMEPQTIAAVAEYGTLDLFVRPPPSIWDGSPMTIQRMSLSIEAAYRPRLLQDYRSSHREVLAGPQMVEKYPDHPLVHRRVIPARTMVDIVDGQPVKTVVPEHLQRFPWETT